MTRTFEVELARAAESGRHRTDVTGTRIEARNGVLFVYTDDNVTAIFAADTWIRVQEKAS